jgi:hypothetical protein
MFVNSSAGFDENSPPDPLLQSEVVATVFDFRVDTKLKMNNGSINSLKARDHGDSRRRFVGTKMSTSFMPPV